MRLPAFLARRSTAEAVAVVGSGLPAAAAALELARRGARVVILGPPGEQRRGLGLALLGPGRPYSEICRRMGRSAARLVWAAGCENHLRIRAFLDETRRDCGYAPRGSFLLAESRAEAAELAESEDMLREDGFPGEFLDHYMLETRFDLSGFPGAYWAAEDAEVDAAGLLRAMVDGARAAGASFEPGRVRAVEDRAGGVSVELDDRVLRVGRALVAADDAVGDLVPGLGPLLRPAARGRLLTAPLRGATLPTAARTANGAFAWQGRDREILLAEVGPALSGAPDALEAFAARIPVDAAGSRRWEERVDVAADGLPLVGRPGGGPVAVACGFGALPAGLSFAAARWVADALLSGNDPTPGPLRAARAIGDV